MSCALVGIGGTGAKILEAFTYLSIMGLPFALDLDEVHVRMVDTDDKNKNKGRLEILLKLYNEELYKLFNDFANGDKEKRWKAAAIKHEHLRVSGDDSKNNYNSTFFWDIGLNKIDTLGSMIEDRALGGGSEFLHMLYSASDQRVPLIEGCHGRPRIGAINYDYHFNNDVQTKGDESFWNSLHGVALKQAMAKDGGKIMFAGSIFGGTGASGIPTLATCFYDHFFGTALNSSIGLAFMLPYYVYDDTGVCKAQSSEFALNSKLVLRYYHDSDFLDNLQKANPSVYIIGQTANPMYKRIKEDGSKENADTAIVEQDNPALPAEIVAAFSALHFFKQPFTAGKKVNVVETSGDEGTLESLPNICFATKGGFAKKSQDKTVSSASAVLRLELFSVLWAVLRKHKPVTSNVTNAPYYNSFHAIQQENAQNWETYLKPVDSFCENAMEWLCQLEINGLNLYGIVGLNNTISMLQEGDRLSPTVKLKNESITEFYLAKIMEAEKEINKRYKSYNDYIKLLFAAMHVCCNCVKY